MAIAGLLALGIMTTIGLSLNPLIEERAGELTSGPARGRDDQVVAAHSIVSRMFIWDTAFNAFRAHPFVGIGVYAFPYTSLRYNNSTLEIYRLYVSGSSPHQTHLAVLAETGIIGAIGFIVFAVATLRVVFGAIRQSSTEPGSRYALVAGIAVVYCFVSMVFSDAWLWGQGIVLLGLVLGLTLANWRISCGFHKPLGLLP
jgi:O-antigen ligase